VTPPSTTNRHTGSALSDDEIEALEQARAELDALTAHERYWPTSQVSAPPSLSPPQRVQRKDTKSPYARKAFGAMVLTFGIAATSIAQGWFSVSVATLMAVGLIFVGGGLVIGTLAGRPTGYIFTGLLLTLGLVGASMFAQTWNKGFGTRTFKPLAIRDVPKSYDLGVGELTVDLSALPVGQNPTTANINLGVGELTITVPDDAEVVVNARARGGEVLAFDSIESGSDLVTKRTFVPKNKVGTLSTNAKPAVRGESSKRRLVVNATIGFGSLAIARKSEMATQLEKRGFDISFGTDSETSRPTVPSFDPPASEVRGGRPD
jgi:hypothetical protein